MLANQSAPGLTRGWSSKFEPCKIYRRIYKIYREAGFHQSNVDKWAKKWIEPELKKNNPWSRNTPTLW